MAFVGELWLPIILSGAFVFIVSALVWTVLPHHKTEWKGLAEEAGVLDALRKSAPAPGLYMFPYCHDPAERQSDAMKQKIREGPSGFVTVVNGATQMNMGGMMVKSFLFNVVVAFFVAYLASHTLERGDAYLTVFRVTGTASIMAYVFASVPESIWFGRPWRSLFLQAADGVFYGLLTAGTFGWLWPR